MDGVLADFKVGIEDYFGERLDSVSIDHEGLYDLTTEMWDEMVDGGIFRDLKPMPALDVMNSLLATAADGKVGIITATGISIEKVGPQKEEWVQDHVSKQVPFHIVIKSHNKAKFANARTVLVDDRRASIDPWVAAGGIGVLIRTVDDFDVMVPDGYQDTLEEGIVLGGTKFPTYGNGVLLMGGPGSGKGFVLSHVLDIDAKVYDVDSIKAGLLRMATDTRSPSHHEMRGHFEEHGIPITKDALRNPENTSKLHALVKSKQYDTRQLNNLIKSVQSSSAKPNVVFDRTGAIPPGQNAHHVIRDLIRLVDECGYNPKRIHVVWVLTPIKNALEQNKKRSRVVPDELVRNIHSEVLTAFNTLVEQIDEIPEIDGDVIIVFNADGDLVPSYTDKGGVQFIPVKRQTDPIFIRVKRSGRPFDQSALSSVGEKIKKYTSDLTIGSGLLQ